jgi:uncharacterized protein YecT (DUF1311 family)
MSGFPVTANMAAATAPANFRLWRQTSRPKALRSFLRKWLVAIRFAPSVFGTRVYELREIVVFQGMGRFRLRLALVVFGLGVLAAAPALAEAADPHDVSAVAACLKSKEAAKQPPENCVSIIARPCFGGDEDAAATGQVIACFDREQLAWDQTLNEAYKQLHDHLDAAGQAKLRDMQRSWIVARKQSCEFFFDYFQGSMANPMIASCMNLETARRAIFLDVFARDAAGLK